MQIECLTLDGHKIRVDEDCEVVEPQNDKGDYIDSHIREVVPSAIMELLTKGRLRITRSDPGSRVTRGSPDNFERELRAGGIGLRVTRSVAENFGRESRAGPLGLRVTRDASKRERRSGLGLRVTRSGEKDEKSGPGIVDYFGRI